MSRPANPTALPWRRTRQITQIVALFVFLALLLVTRGGQFPSLPPSLFFRLDPLALLATLIAGRQWVSGVALGLVTLVLTLAAGRVWCGWICPLGTVLDLTSVRRPASARIAQGKPSREVPATWRTVKYVVLIGILGAALAGNLTLLAFDPISILTRGLATFVLPGLNQALIGLERALYRLPPLQSVLDWFELSVRITLFPADVWRWWNLVPGVLLVSIIALNRVANRFWCRYLCPLGGLLGLVSRAAILRRVVGVDACRQCMRCARACPTGTIDPTKNYASDPAECTVCLDCLPECPTPGGQTFTPVWKLASAQEYDPHRRQMVTALSAGLIAAAAHPLLPASLRRDVHLIRPPGAQGAAFLSTCIRCSECLKVCPTSGLQPALWESGLDGFWTPTLVPRLGYCDYSCNACGQVCPTGAIPNLALEEKRKQVLGKAEINRDRCLPWHDNTPCIVCEEMCPLAPKAVELEQVEITDNAGQPLTLQRPHVVQETCIGCGICEFKCPAQGEAAIRVGREAVAST